MFLKER